MRTLTIHHEWPRCLARGVGLVGFILVLSGDLVQAQARVGLLGAVEASSAMLTAGLPYGSRFPVGATRVIYEASDAAGNIASVSLTVNVRNAARNERPFINRF